MTQVRRIFTDHFAVRDRMSQENKGKIQAVHYPVPDGKIRVNPYNPCHPCAITTKSGP